MSQQNKELMNQYDVVVIGAGIGGLTCGASLAKEGLKTLVVEQHAVPGGYVTSYKRKGFTFDVPDISAACRKEGPIGKIFSELGLWDKIEFIESEPYLKYIFPEHNIRVYTNIEKYKEELIRACPAEKENVNRYYETLAKLWRDMCISPSNPSKVQLLSFPLKYPTLFKYRNKVFKDLLDSHFDDQKLKAILPAHWAYLGLPPSRISALSMVMMLMGYHMGGAWHPKGGYQKLADAFVNSLGKHNGTLLLKALVTKILIQNGRAVGIELKNGTKIKAKYVISNADSKLTFLKLVGEENLKKKFVEKIKSLEMSVSGFVVHLGVDMDLSKLDLNYAAVVYYPSYDIEEPFKAYENNEIPDIDRMHFGISVTSLHDSSLAPEGKHALLITLPVVPYHYKNDWMTESGKKRGEDYRKLKEELADKLIEAAEKIVPDLSKHLVVKDIATPMTYERYTLSSDGAWYDVAITPEQSGLNRVPIKTPIERLYLTGSSTIGAGTTACIISGINTANFILGRKHVNVLAY